MKDFTNWFLVFLEDENDASAAHAWLVENAGHEGFVNNYFISEGVVYSRMYVIKDPQTVLAFRLKFRCADV